MLRLLLILYLAFVSCNSLGHEVIETMHVEYIDGRKFIIKLERVGSPANGQAYDFMYLLYSYEDTFILTFERGMVLTNDYGFRFFQGLLPSPHRTITFPIITIWNGDPNDECHWGNEST
jgi:hypothetical protein|tara:strand:+ start:3339 stop:3695 length:357 start_codon:yes stop_codon:yes gene_type:complete